MGEIFRFAIVGTGDIAGFYMDAFQAREDKQNIRFAGAWNRTLEKGAAFIKKYGGRHYATLHELLGDDQVDAVINLTSAPAHAELTAQCLTAGKHVHSEKPLALSVEEAEKLIRLAKGNNAVLASAPFILLGDNQRRVKQLLEEKRIGRPLMVMAEQLHGRVEAWNPRPQQFYVEGGGPLLDVGPYPFSLLVSWFGPVAEVQGMFTIGMPDRATLEGEPFGVTEYDQGIALLKFKSGVIGRVTLSFCNSKTENHGVEIQGTNGSLRISHVMDFHGELAVSDKDGAAWAEREGDPALKPASGVDWSAGIMELAAAVCESREPAHSAALGLHVLDIALSIRKAAATGQTVRVITDI